MKTGVFPFERFLKKYDVWEFHPLDQGGRLVQLQLIGSEKDADIVAALRQTDFLAPWGEPIQWDRLESSELEKSVWLNRWYYLPSFARQYWLTEDRSFLDDLLKLFRQWISDNPVPTDLPKYFQSRKYNWRDMQVAWRTQNLVWCYFLGQDGFTEAEREELLDALEVHAGVLLAYFGNQPLSVGNHQSHGALAMLYAGLLFSDLTDAAELRDKALEILQHHLETGFFADGNSVELSPGYYPFISANFRDAYLLLQANGITPTRRWKERLTQFHGFMRQIQQPDGTTPPINDSTEVPVSVSLSILREILGLHNNAESAGSIQFVDSDQAVMRDKNSYVFLDAGAGGGWPYHWHAGKLGFHYWHDGRPYLVDSGVCNYDESLRADWYLGAAAHNTILLDGLGDSDAAKRASGKNGSVGSSLSGWRSAPTYDIATMSSTAFESLESPVRWTRKVLLLKRRFLILVDHLQSADAHEYSWLFHFTPTVVRANNTRSRLLTGFDDRNLLLAPFGPQLFAPVEITQGHINQRGRDIPSPVGRFTARAADLMAVFLLLPVSAREFPTVDLQQTMDADSLSLRIHTKQEDVRLRIKPASEVEFSIAAATESISEVTHL
jgi:hypothetical protein